MDGLRYLPAIALCCVSGLSAAQELTPRAYWPAPTGTRLVTVGAVYTRGDLVPDPSLPVTGLNSDITQGFVSLRRTTGWLGRTTNLILDVPFSDGTTSASPELGETVRRDYSGLGDISATISINLMGAPAMDRDGFADLRREPHPLLGASLKVSAPTGDYDNDRVINVGSNRWGAKLELGYMHPLSHRWLVEFDVGVWAFQDNDDFLGSTREQDPIFSGQFHLVHRFGPGFWAALNFNAYRGGRSTIDGQRLSDLQRDAMAGLTLSFPFARRNAVRVSYTTGSTIDNDESFDVFQVAYTRVF